MRRPIIAAFLLGLLFAASPAKAQFVEMLPNGCGSGVQGANTSHLFTNAQGQLCVDLGGSKHMVSSVITKIAGAGTYTGASVTVPKAVCLFASVTPCAPATMAVSANVPRVNGNITGLSLTKSSTGATAATFRVFVFQGVPTLTSVFDAGTYQVPIADINSGSYVGSWECSSLYANTDNASFECSSNRPSGNNAFNLTDGNLRFVVAATGAYVSASSETFAVSADLLVSAQ